MPVTLLMPATIDPGGMALTARADPTIRLRDHCVALERWITLRAFTRIVWCENSGWPLEQIMPLMAKAKTAGIELELVSFRGQDFPSHLGKGFGEMGTIAHALMHARLLAESGHICKVSARYFVNNAASLHRQCQQLQPADVICDLKKSLTVADSRFFAGTTVFFRDRLIPLRAMINDSAQVYFEHALARAAQAAMGAGETWALPAELPRIVGITGTTDKPIHLSITKRLRYQLKRAMFEY